MYEALQAILGGRVRSTWGAEMQTWGTLVRLYRDYADGRQRSFLTKKQRAALNIKTDPTEQIVINYCDMVVQAEAERLTVASIDGETDAASQWSADVLKFNRFDGLQMDVTEPSLRDGVGFVMVGFDNDAQMPILSHEPAWDGECGMMAVWDRLGKSIIAAVKVWYEAENKRVNLYLPDRVIKYRTDDTGQLGAPMQAESWMHNGQSIGVPVVAFPNRKGGRGTSELASVIPLQDTLNRSLIDMIMTSGLTAFQVKVAIGFTPPDTVAPGDWVVAGEGGVAEGQVVDAKVLAAGQLVPFIEQCQFHIDQIGTISRTPLPRFMGADNSSGESLKQKEVGLLGKVERYQVRGGNSWEDVMAMAARVQAAFGAALPPATTRWNCQWKDAEKRNATEEIKNALELRALVGDEEAIRMVATVYEWDEAKIQQVLAAVAAQREQAMRDAMNALNTFPADASTDTANGNDARVPQNGNGTVRVNRVPAAVN